MAACLVGVNTWPQQAQLCGCKQRHTQGARKGCSAAERDERTSTAGALCDLQTPTPTTPPTHPSQDEAASRPPCVLVQPAQLCACSNQRQAAHATAAAANPLQQTSWRVQSCLAAAAAVAGVLVCGRHVGSGHQMHLVLLLLLLMMTAQTAADLQILHHPQAATTMRPRHPCCPCNAAAVTAATPAAAAGGRRLLLLPWRRSGRQQSLPLVLLEMLVPAGWCPAADPPQLPCMPAQTARPAGLPQHRHHQHHHQGLPAVAALAPVSAVVVVAVASSGPSQEAA